MSWNHWLRIWWWNPRGPHVGMPCGGIVSIETRSRSAPDWRFWNWKRHSTRLTPCGDPDVDVDRATRMPKLLYVGSQHTFYPNTWSAQRWSKIKSCSLSFVTLRQKTISSDQNMPMNFEFRYEKWKMKNITSKKWLFLLTDQNPTIGEALTNEKDTSPSRWLDT